MGKIEDSNMVFKNDLDQVYLDILYDIMGCLEISPIEVSYDDYKDTVNYILYYINSEEDLVAYLDYIISYDVVEYKAEYKYVDPETECENCSYNDIINKCRTIISLIPGIHGIVTRGIHGYIENIHDTFSKIKEKRGTKR